MLKSLLKHCAAVTAAVVLLCAPVNINAAASSQSIATWDVEAASQAASVQIKKPYTLMVYMNGSDLESEGGAATDDLLEMLESGLDSRNANILLFTGGTNRWQNTVVPANECVLWEIADGWLYEITGVGQVNMGNPGTLSGFIQFGLRNYPADRYGLIMWDHGGGSIAGYGHDEKFLDSNLTLLDMRDAFEDAGLKNNKLEFIGFDSCLMATVEMAVVASDYARYLIASEDLEPSGGWDYSFLSTLNRNPHMDGKTLGVAVVDAFMCYYGPNTDEILSLSVTDLSKAGHVMDAMGRLMAPCAESLVANKTTSFRTLAGKRNRTKTFGEGTPRDNECDMVDIGDMAVKLSDMYPQESNALLGALTDCVVYNRHNSNAELRGLSTYYIYGGKSVGKPALDTYAALSMNTDYTKYLYRFFDALTGRTVRTRSSGQTSGTTVDGGDFIKTEQVLWRPSGKSGETYQMIGLSSDTGEPATNRLWPRLNGHPVCLYPVNRSSQNELYAIPAQVNGRDCDIMVIFNERNPGGLIEGVRNNEGIIIQKGYDPIKPGDRICLLYMEHTFDGQPVGGEETWRKGTTFKVTGALQLTMQKPDTGMCEGLRQTDIKNDITFTEPQKPLAATSKPSAFSFLRPAFGFATIPQF